MTSVLRGTPDVRTIYCTQCGEPMRVVVPSWTSQEKICNLCKIAMIEGVTR